MPPRSNDQLGTLPPGTLALVLFDRYPYWPSIILSRSEALSQPALVQQMRICEEQKRLVCAVRFLTVNTCAVVQISAVEPLIALRYVEP
jgi:hypothetical protein